MNVVQDRSKDELAQDMLQPCCLAALKGCATGEFFYRSGLWV